jgi:hypothetical protein
VQPQTWEDFLPEAERRVANAYATYGGRGVLAIAPEPFPNQLPNLLPEELAFAESLGVKPTTLGGAGFDETINEGSIKFVVTEGGQLIIGPQEVAGQEISHAVLSGGQPVLTAGQATIAGPGPGGEYYGLAISEHSGHFQPSPESLEIARAIFERFGIVFP